MTIIYKQILDLSQKYETDIASFLSRMIQAPSFSSKEQDVVITIKAEMEKIGFDEVRVDALGSIIGRIGNGPKVIAFDAHIDTVYPGDESLWDSDPFSGEIKDGYVWGRGTSDQKAGMASMVYAAKIIKELDLNNEYSILFTGTVMEEDCDGLCWHYLITEENVKPELVVSTEPTSLKIHRGQRGRMEMTVSVKGLSCHGSAPERGDNALYKMARILLEIEKLNERLKDHSFLGKGTITASQFFFTSPSQCAVPDGATVQVDRRLTVGENLESSVAELKEAAARAGYEDAEVKVLYYEGKAYTGKEFGMEKYFPTWIMDEDSDWLKQAVLSYKNLFDKEPEVDKWTFSTNGVATAGMYNIPTLGFGPGDEKEAHAPNEKCRVSDLSAAAAFYAGLVAKLNNK
ncbi:MAG: YgeY family selenium metabolism-linked hydrolase [Pseudomonadota bacterium]